MTSKNWDVTLHISLHHQDPTLSALLTCKFIHESYLDSNTSFHNPSFSTPSLYFHFANKALLNFAISHKLNPPSYFGLHKSFHLIQAIFLSSKPQPQRNFLYISVLFLHMFFGTLKKEKYNKGKKDMIDLIRQTRSTKDSSFPFHFDSLFVIVLTIYCQKSFFLGLSPIGILRYLNGIFISRELFHFFPLYPLPANYSFMEVYP